MIRKTRFLAKYGIVPMLVLCAFMFISRDSVKAGTLVYSWDGQTVAGDDSGYEPEGTATFEVSGDELTLTLENTGDSGENPAVVLTGLTWDIEGTIIDIDDAIDAEAQTLITIDSSLNVTDEGIEDVSAYWGYKDDISAGDLGEYGVSAVGDLLGGVDSFGTPDIIDDSVLFDGIASHLNGVNFGVLSGDEKGNNELGGNTLHNAFKNQDPFARDTVVFTFDLSGFDFDPEAYITNIQPIFGSAGQTRVPEPTTMLLFGSGLVGLMLYGRRKSRKEADKTS